MTSPATPVNTSELASQKRKPKLSVMLITYNHEKYIAQTLDSILMQETEYDIEINVIEDCSTDKTQQVIMRYVEKYPGKVIPYFNEKNIGFKVTQKNAYRGHLTLKGDYISIIEGDDYWSSPYKIQKQISFLEANPEYVGCAHNVIKIYEDGSKEPHRFLYWPGKPDTITIEDLICLRAYFHTTTLVYRNVFKDKVPKHFESPWSCEIFIAIAHAQYGHIRYFDEDMSVYRQHPEGRFSNMKILDGWFFNIGSLRRYNQWLGYRYFRTFALSIVCYCNVLLRDKGKEAALPSFAQRLKYICIRSLYQVIYFALNVTHKTPFIPRWLRVNNDNFQKYPVFYLYTALLCVLYPMRACITAIREFLGASVATVYAFVRDAIPVTMKERLKEMEKTSKRMAIIRLTIRRKAIFSKRGMCLVATALIKKPRPRLKLK